MMERGEIIENSEEFGRGNRCSICLSMLSATCDGCGKFWKYDEPIFCGRHEHFCLDCVEKTAST